MLWDRIHTISGCMYIVRGCVREIATQYKECVLFSKISKRVLTWMAPADQRVLPKIQTAETDGRAHKSTTVSSSSDERHAGEEQRSDKSLRSAWWGQNKPQTCTASLLQSPALDMQQRHTFRLFSWPPANKKKGEKSYYTPRSFEMKRLVQIRATKPYKASVIRQSTGKRMRLSPAGRHIKAIVMSAAGSKPGYTISFGPRRECR